MRNLSSCGDCLIDSLSGVQYNEGEHDECIYIYICRGWIQKIRSRDEEFYRYMTNEHQESKEQHDGRDFNCKTILHLNIIILLIIIQT